MKNICILLCGGTIGMEKTENGLEPSDISFEKIIGDAVASLCLSFMKVKFCSFGAPIDSSDITYKDLNKYCSFIAENRDFFDAFIVVYGTDTMAYAAALCSFMLKNLNKAVIFTGSQLPLSSFGSDGKANLSNALRIAYDGKINETCICFGEKVLRANRCTKISSYDFEAFDSPMFPYLAKIGTEIEYEDKVFLENSGEFSFAPLKKKKIIILKLYPEFDFSLFEKISGADGVLIEAFGAGNFPSAANGLIEFIKASEIPVVVLSQSVRGKIVPSLYKSGKSLFDAGAIGGKDMVTEAAFSKLYYLLNFCSDYKEVKERMQQNICGEISASAIEKT